MPNPLDLQQANSLASLQPAPGNTGPAPLNTLAQPYQPLSPTQQNALEAAPSNPIGGDDKARALQFIMANKLALDGPNGKFLQALKDFHEHFSAQNAQDAGANPQLGAQ